jgi:methyl-accepting chemotaxis protein
VTQFKREYDIMFGNKLTEKIKNELSKVYTRINAVSTMQLELKGCVDVMSDTQTILSKRLDKVVELVGNLESVIGTQSKRLDAISNQLSDIDDRLSSIALDGVDFDITPSVELVDINDTNNTNDTKVVRLSGDNSVTICEQLGTFCNVILDIAGEHTVTLTCEIDGNSFEIDYNGSIIKGNTKVDVADKLLEHIKN